jgi:hypothetical protein
MSVHMTRWFRRHQKHLMAALVILLMAAFGILTPLSSALGRRGSYMGEIRGQRVLQSDLVAGRGVMAVLSALGMPRIVYYGQDSNLDGSMRWLDQSGLCANMGAMSRFVFDAPDDSDAAAWRALVLLREAEAAGIQATSADAEMLQKTLEGVAQLARSPYAQSGQLLSLQLLRPDFRVTLQDKGFSTSAADAAIVDLLSALRLLSMRCDAVIVNDAEMWAEWSYANENIGVRYVALSAELSKTAVPEPDQAELQKFFDEYKDVQGDPERGVVGYRVPSQARVRYCAVPMDEVKGLVEVTDRQIRAYYKKHKEDSDFREEIEEPDDATAPADTSAAPSADTAAEPEDDEPEYRTKTLEEMKTEIVEILTKEHAGRLAAERLDDARKRLRALAADYPTGVAPLDRVAARSKLKAPRPAFYAGREWLSQDELVQALPGGLTSARFAFDENRRKGDVVYLTRVEPPMLAQLVDFRPERTPDLAEIREQVLTDCRRKLAVKKTRELADDLAKQSHSESLTVAADALSDKLGLKEDARLELVRTDLFPRSAGKLAELDDSFELAQAAFDLEKNGFGVGTAGDVVYVFEVVERRAGSVEEFQATALSQRYGYEMRKQAGEMALWMQGLLGKANYVKPPVPPQQAGDVDDSAPQ